MHGSHSQAHAGQTLQKALTPGSLAGVGPEAAREEAAAELPGTGPEAAERAALPAAAPLLTVRYDFDGQRTMKRKPCAMALTKHGAVCACLRRQHGPE